MSLKLPTVHLPHVSLPSVKLPQVSLPSVNLPFVAELTKDAVKQAVAARRPVELRAPPRPSPLPARPTGLKVASYNIYLGGKQYELIERELTKLSPDVVCIQEASREAVQKLGAKLRMYSAFVDNGTSSKAILSRYPFVPGSPRNDNFHDSLKDRFEAALKSDQTEPMIQRSALSASIKVGGRTVDLIDAHLSLTNPRANAEQLRELGAMMKAREAQGHSVVLAGDFNVNLGLTRAPAADSTTGFSSPTDSIGEWSARYNSGGRSPVGNIADPQVQRAAAALLAGRGSYWQAGRPRVMQFADGRFDASQALGELRSGSVPVGSARWAELMQAADGISHPGAKKRFDNVITSKDLSITRSLIDASTTASDHRPVMTWLRWP